MDSLPTFAIFDFDGTIADSQEGILSSFRSTLDELGVATTDDELRSLIGPPLGESFSALGIAEHDLERVVARYRDFYAETGVHASRLYEGMATTLDLLAAAGVRMGVATAKRVDFADGMLRSLGVRDYFEVVVGASVDGTLTSKVDIVAEVLAYFQPGEPREVWMVGDRAQDVGAARAHGLVAIGVLWGYGTRSELAASGAEHFVTSPFELLELGECDDVGDPVCWAHLLCQNCGAVLDDGHDPTSCVRIVEV
jgi:phosphoglycolate phosphatase-like HAD superfamily hydrolase